MCVEAVEYVISLGAGARASREDAIAGQLIEWTVWDGMRIIQSYWKVPYLSQTCALVVQRQTDAV